MVLRPSMPELVPGADGDLQKSLCPFCSKATHITQKDSAGGGKQPIVRQPQESCLRRSILGKRCTAKVDEDTAATVKCPSALSRGDQYKAPD